MNDSSFCCALDSVYESLSSLIRKRNEYLNSLIGQTLISNFTKLEGKITDINSNKQISINFIHSGSIMVPINKYEAYFEKDDKVDELLNSYLQTFKEERAYKRTISKLEKEKN